MYKIEYNIKNNIILIKKVSKCKIITRSNNIYVRSTNIRIYVINIEI